MDIGIGAPITIPGVTRDVTLEWARRADAGPFSSLSTLDRIVFPNYEPLIALAASAAVTTRIPLLTAILITTLRPVGILAKQVATLDALSGGRLTLGIAVGGREDDFLAAPAAMHTRGRRFEQELATMKRIWAGEAISEQVGPIGPPPARAGGPPLLIGGSAPQALQRAAKWGDGYISGGSGPEAARKNYDIVAEAWQALGRPGKPRFVAGGYYFLGDDVEAQALAYRQAYYSRFSDPMQGVMRTPQEILDRIKADEDVGMDEQLLWPCAADVDQVQRLADVVTGG